MRHAFYRWSTVESTCTLGAPKIYRISRDAGRPLKIHYGCCHQSLHSSVPNFTFLAIRALIALGPLPRAGEGAMPAPLSEKMCQVIVDKVFKQRLTYAVVAE